MLEIKVGHEKWRIVRAELNSFSVKKKKKIKKRDDFLILIVLVPLLEGSNRILGVERNADGSRDDR